MLLASFGEEEKKIEVGLFICLHFLNESYFFFFCEPAKRFFSKAKKHGANKFWFWLTFLLFFLLSLFDPKWWNANRTILSEQETYKQLDNIGTISFFSFSISFPFSMWLFTFCFWCWCWCFILSIMENEEMERFL